MINCSSCEKENAEEARFCSGCGESLESELEQFLRANQLEQLIKTLKENDFTSPGDLHALSDADFQELGISLGLKLRLRTALQQLLSEDDDDEDDEQTDGSEHETNIEAEVDRRAELLAEQLSRLVSVDRVYIAPNIPLDKLTAATGSYAKKPEIEAILLYDVTLFQGAKDGFIVAKDGLYLKETFEAPCYFGYDSIRSVHADENTKLHINGKQVMNCIGIAPISLKRIASVIGLLSGLED
jgi:hypothetical protein